MATPSFVRLMKAKSRSVRVTVTTMTAISSSPSTAAPNARFTPAIGLSSTWGSWPRIAPATKRRTKPIAIVRITTATCDWPKTWRRIARSNSHPVAARAPIAPMHASQNGNPSYVSLARSTATNAPSIIRPPGAGPPVIRGAAPAEHQPTVAGQTDAGGFEHGGIERRAGPVFERRRHHVVEAVEQEGLRVGGCRRSTAEDDRIAAGLGGGRQHIGQGVAQQQAEQRGLDADLQRGLRDVEVDWRSQGRFVVPKGKLGIEDAQAEQPGDGVAEEDEEKQNGRNQQQPDPCGVIEDALIPFDAHRGARFHHFLDASVGHRAHHHFLVVDQLRRRRGGLAPPGHHVVADPAVAVQGPIDIDGIDLVERHAFGHQRALEGVAIDRIGRRHEHRHART